MTKNIHLISRWYIKPGFQKQAELTLQKFEEMSASEPGTLLYLIHRPMWDIDLISRPEPRQLEVLFVEIYESKEAFLTHVTSQQAYLKSADAFRFFTAPKDDPTQVAAMVEFLDFERGFIKPTLKIN